MVDTLLIQSLQLLKHIGCLRLPLLLSILQARQRLRELGAVSLVALGHDFVGPLLRLLDILGQRCHVALRRLNANHIPIVGAIFAQGLLDIAADLLRQGLVRVGERFARRNNALPWCLEDSEVR